MQRRIERSIRKQRRLQTACEAAGLEEDAQAANIKLRRLNQKYKAFSKAAELPEQKERMRVLYVGNPPNKAETTFVAQTKPSAMEPRTSKLVDVTEEYLSSATPNSHIVRDLNTYVVNGVTYVVDGHNVVLDYSLQEKEIAEALEKKLGGEIFMVPRINNPQGVPTPDYLFRGKGYDLKTIGAGAGPNTIVNRIKKAKKQAHNFVVDITSSGLSEELVDAQLDRIFRDKETEFVEVIVVVRNGELVKVIKRA